MNSLCVFVRLQKSASVDFAQDVLMSLGERLWVGLLDLFIDMKNCLFGVLTRGHWRNREMRDTVFKIWMS